MNTLNELGKRVIEAEKQRDKLKDDVLAWAVTCKNLERENKKLKEQIDTSQVSRLIAENEQLKEEVEHLNSIIQDEEDWKLLKLEEEWL